MLKTIIWDLKMLTFIDGEPIKAGLFLRGSTVQLGRRLVWSSVWERVVWECMTSCPDDGIKA